MSSADTFQRRAKHVDTSKIRRRQAQRGTVQLSARRAPRLERPRPFRQFILRAVSRRSGRDFADQRELERRTVAVTNGISEKRSLIHLPDLYAYLGRDTSLKKARIYIDERPVSLGRAGLDGGARLRVRGQALLSAHGDDE